MMYKTLKQFIEESNRIEGIVRSARPYEIAAHEKFVCLSKITVQDIVEFVAIAQPDARLRDNISVPGVRVGNHIAPPSGPEIRELLEYNLKVIDSFTPFEFHCKYLNLHPFTDGNGRSSRVIWLWMMKGRAPLGFLHQFYYQTLDGQDSRIV